MTAAWIRAQADAPFKAHLNGVVFRTALRRITEHFPDSLAPPLAVRIRDAFRADMLASRAPEFATVVTAFKDRLVSEAEEVWEKFFQDYFDGEIRRLDTLNDYTQFLTHLGQDRAAAIAKATHIDAQVTANVAAVATAKEATDAEVDDIAQQDVIENGNRSQRRANAYLTRQITGYRQRAAQITAGARAAIEATPFPARCATGCSMRATRSTRSKSNR